MKLKYLRLLAAIYGENVHSGRMVCVERTVFCLSISMACIEFAPLSSSATDLPGGSCLLFVLDCSSGHKPSGRFDRVSPLPDFRHNLRTFEKSGLIGPATNISSSVSSVLRHSYPQAQLPQKQREQHAAEA